jgi:hypothetical protein
LDLAWQAPSACPDAAAMQARVGRMLAGSVARADAIHADGRIEQHGDRWRLSLALDVGGHHATRQLEDSDCASLSETAAWLVSVAIDPNVAAPEGLESGVPEAAPPQSEPTGEDATAPQQPSAQTPPAMPEQASESSAAALPLRLRVRLGLFGGGLAAGFAGLAASAGAEAGVELGWFSAALFGAHHFERSHDLDAPGTSVDFSSLELGLVACAEWGDTLRAGPCLVVSGLRTAASTEGVAQGRDDSFVWGTAGASLAARYRFWDPLELWLDAGLWLPISSRPRFFVESLGTAGEAAAYGGRFRLGIAWRLP